MEEEEEEEEETGAEAPVASKPSTSYKDEYIHRAKVSASAPA